MFDIFNFFKKLFKCTGGTTQTDTVKAEQKYGKVYFPLIVRDSADFAKFRDECLPKWLDFYKSKGVIYEVVYVTRRGPELIRSAVSKYEYHYGVNLNLGNGQTERSLVGEVGTMPNGDTFVSFARFQELTGKFFGIREIDISKGKVNKLCEIFEREIAEYNTQGKALSIYTPDEERFALESRYLKEKNLVDEELALSPTSYKNDREVHSVDSEYKVLVPCGHGDGDYTTGHRYDSYNNTHGKNIIVSDTCEFLEDLGTISPVGDYLAVFGNTNFGWGDATLVTPNWLQKLFGAKEHIELAGSTKYVEYFLSCIKSQTLGQAAYNTIKNLDGSCNRILNGQTFGSKDTVAGKSYDFADASFVLFGNPAFRY